MRISLIVAMASNRVIGFNNQIPWHLSSDLKKFKRITLGSPILMGRKTYESIGKPLPKRTNIIISRNPDYSAEGCLVFDQIDKAIAACQENVEIFVIGGAALYKLILPKAHAIYLTQINKEFIGDTYFPMIKQTQWKEVHREDVANDKTVNFSYSFIKLLRNN